MSDEKNGEDLAAEALRRVLEGEQAEVDGEEGELLEVAQRIMAAAGHAPPLDSSVKASALAAALQSAPAPARKQLPAAPASTRRWLRWGVAALAAAVAIVAMGSLVTLSLLRDLRDGSSVAAGPAAPAEAYSAPTDSVFDAPFPDGQSAAERMDRILAARTRGYFSALAARTGSGAERAGDEVATGVRVATAKRWTQ